MHMRLFYVLVNNFSVMLASGLNQNLAEDIVFCSRTVWVSIIGFLKQ